MSVEELAGCAREAAALQAENARLAGRRAALSERKSRLAGEMAETARARRRGAADEALHRAQGEALTAVNRDVDALNGDSRRMQMRQARYNAGCATRSYRKPDIAALSPELRHALEAGRIRAADTMSFDELRACAERALSTDLDRQAASAAELTARRAALDAERKALEAKGADVDRLARSELEALRAQRRAFNAKVDALNAEVQARNAAAQTGNAAALAYETACATRPYLEEDAARLPPHLQAALRRQAGEAR